MIGVNLFDEDDSMSSLPARENSAEERDTQRRCRILKIVCLLVVFVVGMRMWVIGVLGHMDFQATRGAWQRTQATFVGANATNSTITTGAQKERTYYCPLVNYTTSKGETITSILKSFCISSLKGASLLVGRTEEVRYNPNNPEEVLADDEYQRERNLWTLSIASGILLSLIFGCLLIRTVRKNSNGDGTSNHQGETELAGLTRREREELIRSKLHFQTVSIDKSNVVFSNIRAETMREHKQKKDEEEGMDTSEEIDEEVVGDLPRKVVESSSSASLPTSPPSSSKSPVASATRCTDKDKDSGGEVDTSGEIDEDIVGDLPLEVGESSSSTHPGGSECAICLQEYQPGELICTAKTDECNHAFHEKCVMDWLLGNHDECPLCRVNFLITTKDSGSVAEV